MKTLNPIVVLRQLKKNSKQLQKMITNGKFKQLTFKKRQQWLSRIERLKQQLKKFGQFKTIRQAIAGAAVVLSLAVGNTAVAQTSANFTPVQTNPFGLSSTLDFGFISMGDLDDDGDYDLIAGEYYGNIKYFENQGDSVTPSFNLITTNSPFTSINSYYTMPTLVDMDNDGDLDLFITGYSASVDYYENTGTPSQASFSSAQNQPFGLNTLNLSYFLHFAFADIDGDSDLDILAGSYYGTIYYFQNTGTQQNPNFATPVTNPFGMTAITNSDYSFISVTDIDNDGDFDMFIGVEYGDILYYENTGNSTNPVFGTSVTNPFNINLNNGNTYVAIPFFVDIDDDGDSDMFSGTAGSNGEILFQEQGAPNNIPMSADTTITINQDEVFTFDASNFPFSDADMNDNLVNVKIKSLPASGTFTYTGLNLLIDFEVPANDLINMVYQPNAGLFGQNFDNFQFEVSDGTDYSSVHTFTFNVNALPSTTQTTVETVQDTDYVFDVADFTFNDPDGGSFQEIQIVTLPSEGQVLYNGTVVAAGDTIPTSDFANLVFSPDAGETGFPYTDFQFAVGDGTGFSQPATIFVEVDFPSSTDDINEESSFVITPNPSSDFVNLQIQTTINQEARLSVTNIAGQVVLNQNIVLNGDFNTRIDVSNWSKGLYILQVKTEEGTVWTEKLVIQ